MLRTLAFTLLLLALLAVPAQASRSQVTYFEAPRDFLDAGTRDGAFDEVDGLGARAVRIVMLWGKVAPDPDSRVAPRADPPDPGVYNGGEYAAAADAARARGMSVLLPVSGPVPTWATNGARDPLTPPSPAGYRRFMTAVARH